jgi:lipid-binding SYLF domain-containing protein
MTVRHTLLATVFATAAALSLSTAAQAASNAQELNADSTQALRHLTETNRTAADMAAHARAILIFPNVVKAGLVFGGAYGEGELTRNGKVVDYYNSVTGSWGFQAGAQSYGYVVFLMTDKAVKYVSDTAGWEFGVGPTIVVVNDGMAKNLSTSTLKDDAYAFIFDQQGLMAGVSIEGTKITRINRPGDKRVER